MRAIITVAGKDRVGIIASVTHTLAERNVNVLDITQTILPPDFFTMVMLVDLTGMKASYKEMTDVLNRTAEAIGVEIRMQRSEIFDAMHRI